MCRDFKHPKGKRELPAVSMEMTYWASCEVSLRSAGEYSQKQGQATKGQAGEGTMPAGDWPEESAKAMYTSDAQRAILRQDDSVMVHLVDCQQLTDSISA